MGMPVTKTYYMLNSDLGGSQYNTSITAPAFSFMNNTSGWVVATTAAPRFHKVDFQTEAAQAAGSPIPWTGITSSANVGNCIGIGPLNGIFLPGNWAITMSIKANSNGTPGSGSFVYELWKGPSSDGSGATRFTASYYSSSLGRCTAIVHQSLTTTLDLSEIILKNEYLFFMTQWRTTTAGGNANADINLYVGPNSQSVIKTTSFQSSPMLYVNWEDDIY
jgi:hypothetical protein